MITNFLNKDNVKILWDVISDEDIIKTQSLDFKENIFNLFTSNIKGFYDVESKKATNLVELNKKYIMLVLNHSNKVIKNNMSTEIKKIKISNETPNNVNELITYEEIQNDRRSQFDKDLNKRQEEFTNLMSLPVPPVPKFNDSLDDGPISEMEKAIQEITAQRNYDVEQINRNNNNNLIANSNVDNWLKPQETSVKTDKFVQPIENNNNNGNKLKYIKIDNSEIDNSIYQNQVIDLGNNKEQESPKKNVTWGKNEFYSKSQANEIKLEMEEIEKDNDKNNDNDNNIFKLFKKVPIQTTEEKISILQQDVKNLNTKIDNILDLLNRTLIK
jgi:hypothetical protein